MLKWVSKLLGDPNARELKRLEPIVAQINALEDEMTSHTDEDLREKTAEWSERSQGDPAGLEEMLPEAFAAVREASRRAIGLRHYDVQLVGGIVLHEGKIAEMKTGEGKTLVATLPLYLNALAGRGAHLVTVNDYLAKRDAQWMGPVYHLLGLTVGVIQHESAFLYDPEYVAEDSRLRNLREVPRTEAYRADITYGTNNEFGFDYLRDNMVNDPNNRVQRGLAYAIVDEVDNILVDEARTPLIISSPAEEATQLYYRFAELVRHLQRGTDFTIDEKTKTVTLTEDGISHVERRLNITNIYAAENNQLTHFLDQALKAEYIFKRDRDYVLVLDGQVVSSRAPNAEVVIVDEFTGRLMFGRRYSEGLHQAIEAKENVRIQRESLTWATITFQNLFRMYGKLAGMTGTAATEAEEFHKIYGLDVVVIPTHRPMIRVDNSDLVYKKESAKFKAVVDEIEECHKQERPVLVGTVSIEKSEHLSEMLQRRHVTHQILNAKYHEKEAAIIAQAGRPGAVTIATNMAGRGVDILLGGNPAGLVEEALVRRGLDRQTATPEQIASAQREMEARCAADKEKVLALGGLYIVGTERHEARRIDNQLRGRSGRQGDPGASRFYVSLEDELMRRFGGSSIAGIMDRLGLEDSVPIEHGIVSKSIENAQTKVEGYNFDIRKHLVEYDDVVNKQREVIYAEREKVLQQENLRDLVLKMVHGQVDEYLGAYVETAGAEDWDLAGLVVSFRGMIPVELKPEDLQKLSKDELADHLHALADDIYEQKEQQLGAETMRQIERAVMLQTIDRLWVEHLTALDDLRQGIGLRAYGQQDPLVAFKSEGYAMFDGLKAAIERMVTHTMYHATIVREPSRPPQNLQTNREAAEAGQPQRRNSKKVGRNDPCPCGSGKKYKRCHGA